MKELKGKHMGLKRESSDKIRIKQKKGTWRRFFRLFPKCRLPWVWLIVYIVLEIGLVNVGISETDYTARLFAGDTSAALLARLVGFMALNLVGSNLVVFTRQVTSARINRNMRNVVLNKVMNLPMGYFRDENPREAIYRIVNNSVMIDSTIMLFLLPVFTAFYKAVSIIGKIFQYDWRLSVILLAFIPFQMLLAFLFGRVNFSLTERDTQIKSDLTRKLAELVTNIPLAKAFAKEEKETENGKELTARLYNINIKTSWFDQLQELSQTAVDLLQSIAIVLVGVLLLRNEAITARTWIAFFLFSSVFSGAVTEFVMYWNNIKIIQGGANRVAEIMDAPEEDKSGAACGKLGGDLVLSHVCFGYEEGRPVLKDVNCTFKDHSITALLGASGCGKTTLANLLMRLYTPQDGSICAAGVSIHGYALEEYRNQFVMVSQNGMLFSGSVRENVCYGNGAVSDEDFYGALKQAGAYDFVMGLPRQADTLLEEYGNNLSGGQRQRLSAARALLSRAHYLILDEPAASMDAVAAAEFMDILKNIAAGRCMIIIAHTPAVLSLADRAVILEDGCITAEGEMANLLKSSAFLREFTRKEADR